MDVAQLRQRKEEILSGHAKINVMVGQKKKLETVKRTEQRTRDMLVKFSKRCCVAACNRKQRWFTIDNGELLVYKSVSESAPLSRNYKLMDARIYVEKRGAVQYPAWDDGYDVRLRVDAKERQQENRGPLFLYAKEPQKVNRWKRAFQMARVLTSENDRRALKVSIGRAASGALIKGWDCLVQYWKEMVSTKALVKQMAMRLMKVEVSRGYSKMRAIYKAHLGRELFRREQQIWAARFMSERLGKISKLLVQRAFPWALECPCRFHQSSSVLASPCQFTRPTVVFGSTTNLAQVNFGLITSRTLPSLAFLGSASQGKTISWWETSTASGPRSDLAPQARST